MFTTGSSHFLHLAFTLIPLYKEAEVPKGFTMTTLGHPLFEQRTVKAVDGLREGFRLVMLPDGTEKGGLESETFGDGVLVRSMPCCGLRLAISGLLGGYDIVWFGLRGIKERV